nr:hypothetical protein [uncultured Brevundimonas sp.]
MALGLDLARQRVGQVLCETEFSLAALQVFVGPALGDLGVSKSPQIVIEGASGLNQMRQLLHAAGDLLLPLQRLERIRLQLQASKGRKPVLKIMDVLLNLAVALNGVAQLADIDVILFEQIGPDKILDRGDLMKGQGEDKGAGEPVGIGPLSLCENQPHVLAHEIAGLDLPPQFVPPCLAGHFEAVAHDRPFGGPQCAVRGLFQEEAGLGANALGDIATENDSGVARRGLHAKTDRDRRSITSGILERQGDMGDGLIAKRHALVEPPQAIALQGAFGTSRSFARRSIVLVKAGGSAGHNGLDQVDEGRLSRPVLTEDCAIADDIQISSRQEMPLDERDST